MGYRAESPREREERLVGVDGFEGRRGNASLEGRCVGGDDDDNDVTPRRRWRWAARERVRDRRMVSSAVESSRAVAERVGVRRCRRRARRLHGSNRIENPCGHDERRRRRRVNQFRKGPVWYRTGG